MKPNIFEIATKELSQDAFFTWLFKWASPTVKKLDENLHNCSIEFLNFILKKQSITINKITDIEAGRQWNNIDIWIDINKKYRIIIEDKTYTSEHSNQLNKYKNFATEWCRENNRKLICIYLKTGNESKTSQTNYRRERILYSQQKRNN